MTVQNALCFIKVEEGLNLCTYVFSEVFVNLFVDGVLSQVFQGFSVVVRRVENN